MSDYKRLVSYIYSYPGGVRDKNVGFAKAEVRGGQFKLSVSLKGVYTDAPENFGIYLMVERDPESEGRFMLLLLGNVIVNGGMGQYADLLNPENIRQSGYSFSDISGIAVARQDNRYYMMFSLWEDCSVAPEKVYFAPQDYKRPPAGSSDENNIEMPQEPAESAAETPEAGEQPEDQQQESTAQRQMQSEDVQSNEQAESAQQEEDKALSDIPAFARREYAQTEKKGTTPLELAAASAEAVRALKEEKVKEKANTATAVSDLGFEKLFENADFINAFDDDYYYDCVEVSPEVLKSLPIEDEAITNNSFLLHGYYNFKHLLFGRVCPNENHTKYFIGVPGMYCNRERFMASMFGFNNFKKSHRSDYSNPYFGYWYQEI